MGEVCTSSWRRVGESKGSFLRGPGRGHRPSPRWEGPQHCLRLRLRRRSGGRELPWLLRTSLTLKLEEPGLLQDQPGLATDLQGVPSPISQGPEPSSPTLLPATIARFSGGLATMSRTEAPSSPDLQTFGLGGARHSDVVRVSPTAGRLQPSLWEQRLAEASRKAGVIAGPGVDFFSRAQLGCVSLLPGA